MSLACERGNCDSERCSECPRVPEQGSGGRWFQTQAATSQDPSSCWLLVGSLDQPRPHHLGTWEKCRFSAPPQTDWIRGWGWGPQSPLQEWDVHRGLRTTALTDPSYPSRRPFPPALRGWTAVAGSSSGLLWGAGSVRTGHCPGLRCFLFSVFGDCDQPRLSSQLASQGCAPIFLGSSSTDLLLSLGFRPPGVSTTLISNSRTWAKPPCTDVSFGLLVPAPHRGVRSHPLPPLVHAAHVVSAYMPAWSTVSNTVPPLSADGNPRPERVKVGQGCPARQGQSRGWRKSSQVSTWPSLIAWSLLWG